MTPGWPAWPGAVTEGRLALHMWWQDHPCGAGNHARLARHAGRQAGAETRGSGGGGAGASLMGTPCRPGAWASM